MSKSTMNGPAASAVLPATSRLHEAIAELSSLREKSYDEMSALQQKLQSQEQHSLGLQHRVDVLNTTMKELEVQLAHSKGNSDTLKRQMTELRNNYDSTVQEKQTLKKDIEELRTRLSKAISDKIVASNADVCDLSDEYRPTKIVERYTELYDNQWTEAYEVFSKLGLKEQAIVEILRDILINSWLYCNALSKDQVKRLQDALLIPVSGESVHMPDSILRQFQENRKACAEAVIKAEVQKYWMYLLQSQGMLKQCSSQVFPFVQECFRLSYYMAIQNKPIRVDLESRPGDTYDPKKYRQFTLRGETIDFIVWPSLSLGDGKLLSKGIAQCKVAKSEAGTFTAETRLEERSQCEPCRQDHDREIEPNNDDIEKTKSKQEMGKDMKHFNGQTVYWERGNDTQDETWGGEYAIAHQGHEEVKDRHDSFIDEEKHDWVRDDIQSDFATHEGQRGGIHDNEPRYGDKKWEPRDGATKTERLDSDTQTQPRDGDTKTEPLDKNKEPHGSGKVKGQRDVGNVGKIRGGREDKQQCDDGNVAEPRGSGEDKRHRDAANVGEPLGSDNDKRQLDRGNVGEPHGSDDDKGLLDRGNVGEPRGGDDNKRQLDEGNVGEPRGGDDDKRQLDEGNIRESRGGDDDKRQLDDGNIREPRGGDDDKRRLDEGNIREPRGGDDDKRRLDGGNVGEPHGGDEAQKQSESYKDGGRKGNVHSNCKNKNKNTYKKNKNL